MRIAHPDSVEAVSYTHLDVYKRQPSDRGLAQAKKIFDKALKAGFRRFRVSVIDMYPHVRERFLKAGLPLPYGPNGFSPSVEQLRAVDKMLEEIWYRAPQAQIESCAEPGLQVPIKCGCISSYDLELLGLDEPDADAAGPQRKKMCIRDRSMHMLHPK